MSYCQLCGEETFALDSHCEKYYKGLTVCDDCYQFLEENDGYTGKLVVEKCKTCKQITDVRFEKYKTRGRKIGSKNKKTDKNHQLEKYKETEV